MRLIVLSILILTLAVGCGTKKPTEPAGPTGQFQATVNQSSFTDNEIIILAFTNGLNQPVFVNHCPGPELQRFDQGIWMSVWPIPQVCLDILPPMLASGASMKFEFEAAAESGTYRFRQGIWEGSLSNQSREVYSASFQIE